MGNMQKTSAFCKVICAYIVIMIFGMLISNYFIVLNKTTTFWLVNVVGFVIFLGGYFVIQKSINVKALLLAIAFLLLSSLTLLFHSDHLFDDAKSIGLNINILVVAFSLTIFCNNPSKKELSDYDLIIINRLILLIGFASTVYLFLFSTFSFSSIFNAGNIYTVALRSFFDNKNTFGIYSLFSIISGIYLIFKDKYKKITLLLLLSQLFSLIISFSRSALLLLFVFLFVFMILALRTKNVFNIKEKNIFKFSVFVLLSITAFILLFYVFNYRFRDFVLRAIIRSDFGDAGRTNYWQRGVELIDFNNLFDVIFGIGWSELNASGYSYLHNIYVEIFVVGGLAKIVFYLFIVVYGFHLFFIKRYNKSLAELFGLSILLSYLLYGFLESQIIFELGIAPFLFVLYIFVIPQNYNQSEKNEF